MLAIIPIPAFADNYIWLLRDGAAAAVVDPGDAAPVIAYFEREGVAPTAIIATHHHGDHVGGIRDLLARWAVPVYGPANEAIPGRTQALREGDAIVVPGIGLALSTLDIPGHTAGHIALVGKDMVFCGDTLFAAGCGRLFEGTPAQMVASLAKLAALPDATRIYCGHEYTVSNLRFALAVEPGFGCAEGTAGTRAGRARAGRPYAAHDDRRRTRHQSVPPCPRGLDPRRGRTPCGTCAGWTGRRFRSAARLEKQRSV